MAEPPVERVFWVVGARRRARVRLQGSFFVIGRGEPVPVFQDDPQISREHATIVATPAGVRIKDLGSRNGVLVNGKRLDRWAEVALGEGDELQVGATTVRLLSSGEAEAAHDGDDLRVDKDGVIRALRLVARAAPDRSPTLVPARGEPKAEPAPAASDPEIADLILDPGSNDDLSTEDDPLRTEDALEDVPDLEPDADLEGEITSELDVPAISEGEPATPAAPAPESIDAGAPEDDGLGDAPTGNTTADGPDDEEPRALEPG